MVSDVAALVPPNGVWIIYLWDMGIHVHSVYETEIEALRAAVSEGYLRVAFIGFGSVINDAIQV
jgi:hypothetical protein